VYRRLGTTEQALLELGILLFSMEREKKIINWEQDFLHAAEYCQQLKE